MAKFEKVRTPDVHSFSDWQVPDMTAYKMACCDCGLVHDLQFAVIRIVNDLGAGVLQTQDVEDKSYIVKFRAKRNNRSSGQMRRHRRKNLKVS